MKKQPGCISPAGVLAALLFLVIVAYYTLLNGGTLFSPGGLTAMGSSGVSLEGYDSHAEFENQCSRCHRPWRGVDPLRCVACHANVPEQISSRDGLHGQLQNPEACNVCHTEHQGREANITAAALPDFPHNQVGFSLVRHRQHADRRTFACADCHRTSDYAFDQTLCETCHIEMDAAYVIQHVSDYGRDCLACHDGSGAMADFDHDASFALEGVHATLACSDCHVDGKYKELPSDCVACHEEPDVHRGQFGADCAACHTAQAWTPARLLQHTFPLNHGSRTVAEVECQVCHPANYVIYSCYDCHEHDPAQVRQKHLEEEIRHFENCVECHPTGREDESRTGMMIDFAGAEEA